MLCVPRQFEKLDALAHVGLLRRLVPSDLSEAATLLLSPLRGHLVIEVAADPPIELVEVHGTNAVAEPLVLSLKSPDRLFVFPTLVGMAGVQCLANPGEHLVIQPEPAKQFSELLLQHLLADITAAARGRFTLAFIRVPGAVIIDVALLLDLADHRATALGAGYEP